MFDIKRLLGKRLPLLVYKWQSLSAITFILFWILWIMTDFPEFDKEGYSIGIFLFDYVYCSTFTICVIAVCEWMIYLLSSWMKKRWLFILSSLACITINVLLSLLFEKTVNILFFASIEEKIAIEGFYIYSLIATFLSILLLSNRYYNLYINELKERKKNEFMLLKQQLDPHFLFNNLNTLDALIESDAETAHLYLNKLSHCYRYITKNINIESVEVDAAISFINMYNELLQISIPGHFIMEIEDNLKHNYDRIIPMSLQMLVENAIKHNSHSVERPIHINIKSEGEYITVTNTYQPIKQTSKNTKIGLVNLNKMCSYIMGKECITSHTDTLFEVKIPIIKNHKYESTCHRR